MSCAETKEEKKKVDTHLSGATSATPILIAAKNGITEMIMKILESYPVAVYDVDKDKKNIVLVAVENKQPHVYELLLSMKKNQKIIQESVFFEVDCERNSVLHLAAKKGDFNWPVPGAASQMQWDIKWYEVRPKSTKLKSAFLDHCLQGPIIFS